MNKINYDKKMQEIIKKMDTKKKLLLQVCCAPCSSAVVTRIREYFDIDIYFYNPNIYPAEEYNKRANVVKEFMGRIDQGINVIIEKNDPNEYYDYVKNRKNEKEGSRSCYDCYYLRMKKTAIYAKEHNYDFFTTSLSISPHKNSAWINEIGEKLQNEYKINFLYSDFKKKEGYKKSIELSKEYELYRQDYCGCIYSFKERKLQNNEL